MSGEQLARVRRICAALPQTSERLSHGEPTFFVGGKVYVMFADDHHGDGRAAVWLPAPPGFQEGLIATSPAIFFRPPYVGHRGWVGVVLAAISDADLRLHIETAWDLIAPKRPRAARAARQAVIAWLLDSDPALRWQVLRDLAGAPAEAVAAERARVATEGLGARLLALQGADGTWAGAAWNRGWDSTMHVLTLLRELGLDPAGEAARRAVGLVRDRVTWRGWDWEGTWRGEGFVGTPFFAGEVEPCINGQVGASGAYFGQDIRRIIDRLLAEQLPDGGWNCEAASGATRSSFHTTICALEALLEYELAGGGDDAVTAARLRGQDYLLERRLLRRRSTGAVIADRKAPGADWTRFAFPTWWHYDVLRGLAYLRRAGAGPDERLSEAIALVESKRDADGRWPLEAQYPGAMPVELDAGVGRPSRWMTLRALRVLDWYYGATP